MEFKFNVRGDRISPSEEYLFIEGNKGSYEAVFDFDEEWDELAKLCIVRCGDKKYSIAILGNSCLLPELNKNSAKIGVVGVDALDPELVTRISTNMLGIGVQSGAYDEEASQELSTAAEVWEHYLSEMEEKRKAAEVAAADAKKSKDDSTKAAEEAKEAAENTNILDVTAVKGDEALVETEKIEGGIRLHFTLPKGEKGDKGDAGEQGRQGPQGIQGERGYTPVKGVDYLTPQEKSDLYMELNIDVVNAESQARDYALQKNIDNKADISYVDVKVSERTHEMNNSVYPLLLEMWEQKIPDLKTRMTTAENLLSQYDVELQQFGREKADTTYVNEKTSALEGRIDENSISINTLNGDLIGFIFDLQNKADITYVDNTISSAIGEALEADY